MERSNARTSHVRQTGYRFSGFIMEPDSGAAQEVVRENRTVR